VLYVESEMENSLNIRNIPNNAIINALLKGEKSWANIINNNNNNNNSNNNSNNNNNNNNDNNNNNNSVSNSKTEILKSVIETEGDYISESYTNKLKKFVEENKTIPDKMLKKALPEKIKELEKYNMTNLRYFIMYDKNRALIRNREQHYIKVMKDNDFTADEIEEIVELLRPLIVNKLIFVKESLYSYLPASMKMKEKLAYAQILFEIFAKRELDELKGIKYEERIMQFKKDKYTTTKKGTRYLKALGPLGEEIIAEIKQKIKDGYLKKKVNDKSIFEYIAEVKNETGRFPEYSNIKSKFGKQKSKNSTRKAGKQHSQSFTQKKKYFTGFKQAK
jgi:hypothetical protein